MQMLNAVITTIATIIIFLQFALKIFFVVFKLLCAARTYSCGCNSVYLSFKQCTINL